jgi:hypothetical protein
MGRTKAKAAVVGLAEMWLCFAHKAKAAVVGLAEMWLCFAHKAKAAVVGLAEMWLCFAHKAKAAVVGLAEMWLCFAYKAKGAVVGLPDVWLCCLQCSPPRSRPRRRYLYQGRIPMGRPKAKAAVVGIAEVCFITYKTKKGVLVGVI